MLVGEVRCAIRPSGTSWKLSGGSQWSASPTNVSKNSQVLRRDPPQGAALGVGQQRVGHRAGPAEEVGHPGRQEPRDQERRRRDHRAGPHGDDQHEDRDRQRRPRPHPLDEVRQVGPQPLLGRGGRLPLQQLAAAHEQPRQRAHDRVEQHAGPIGQEDDVHADLARTPPAGSRATSSSGESDPERMLPITTDNTVWIKGSTKTRSGHRRPGPRRAGQHGPAEDQEQEQRGRDQAAAQVVQQLPALQERAADCCDGPCPPPPATLPPSTLPARGTRGPSQGRSCQSPRTHRCSRRA